MAEELDDVGFAAWLPAYMGMDQFGLAAFAQCHEPIGLGKLYKTWIIGAIGVDAVAVNAENDVSAMYAPVDVAEGVCRFDVSDGIGVIEIQYSHILEKVSV